MPKSLPEELIDRIQTAYLSDETESYASLASRFSVGKSTLERLGRQRDWARRRDQKLARQSQKLLKQQVNNANQALNRIESLDLCEFDKYKLLKIVEQGLITFEAAFIANSDNPKLLPGLAAGMAKLIEIHTKLKPPTVSDLVEILIKANISPDEFLGQLRAERETRFLKN